MLTQNMQLDIINNFFSLKESINMRKRIIVNEK